MDTCSALKRWRRSAVAGGKRSLAARAATPRAPLASTAVAVAAVAMALVALAPVAKAQDAPSWVVVGDGAYVEAFSYPGTMTQEDTAIFVICDPDAPSGLNVRLWIGGNVAPPEEAEGLVRLGQGEVQRYPWFVGGANGDRATPKFFDDVDRFLDDLRSGGTMAIRLLIQPGAPDANQPTFQYDVSGFGEVERQLACAAGTPGAPDPFGGTPADPFAAPPVAATPAPAAPAPAAPATPSPPASPRTRAGASPAAPPAAPPAAADAPTTTPLPPMPPPPSQMAPPAAAAPPAPAGTTEGWYLYPNALELTIDVGDRTLGFVCLDDDDLAAYVRFPGDGVASDEDGLTTFSFVYDSIAADADEWVFLDLGDGLYATDTTASYVIAFSLEVSDRVHVAYGDRVLLEAPGGDRFYALTVQMPCLADED